MSLLAAGTALGAVPALSACGSSAEQEPSEGNVELTMTVWGGKPDEDTYKERLALAKQKFPNINVKLEITPDGGAYGDKLSTAIAGGKGPDILELAEHTAAFASKNQILPLDDYIAKDGLDLASMFGPTVPQIFKYEDKQYAIPDRSGAMVLYYNKTLFDKAGMKYPSAEWTWDDLLSAAQKLTIRQGSKTVQLFDLRSVGEVYYQLRNIHSDKCASVADWSTADGAAIVQWTCNDDSANQRWLLG